MEKTIKPVKRVSIVDTFRIMEIGQSVRFPFIQGDTIRPTLIKLKREGLNFSSERDKLKNEVTYTRIS